MKRYISRLINKLLRRNRKTSSVVVTAEEMAERVLERYDYCTKHFVRKESLPSYGYPRAAGQSYCRACREEIIQLAAATIDAAITIIKNARIKDQNGN
jgi:hypothetical protein